MADIKLFNIKGTVTEYESKIVPLEKELQTVIENNMESFFGITFLASEYRIPNGRMDSIGIDENNCPVILEYKRSQNENVINQGLFYLNWLLDHKDSFKVLVIEKLGLKQAKEIDWTMPRVLCIANDFTKYDEAAIKQMNRNISLIRYKKFGNDLLMFEHLNENVVAALPEESIQHLAVNPAISRTSFAEHLHNAEEKFQSLYEDIRNYILSLGDDIVESQLQLYVAFKKIRNIVCVEVYNTRILLHLRLDHTNVEYEAGFSRDVSNIGHYGTGDVEVSIRNADDFEKAKPLIERAYNEN